MTVMFLAGSSVAGLEKQNVNDAVSNLDYTTSNDWMRI
jgi:hypothetical protein